MHAFVAPLLPELLLEELVPELLPEELLLEELLPELLLELLLLELVPLSLPELPPPPPPPHAAASRQTVPISKVEEVVRMKEWADMMNTLQQCNEGEMAQVGLKLRSGRPSLDF